MWPSGYGVRLRHSFFCKLCNASVRFAAAAYKFLLKSLLPRKKKITRKKKRNLYTKNRPTHIIKYNMSDNEGGDAAAEVDFNDDLFTCANVRLFAHAAYLFIYRFKTLSLSLRDFFFVVVLLRGGVLIFLRLVKLHHHHR